MLRNTSPNADALNVYVLVNFVMADGQAIGTKAETIDAIPAGTHLRVRRLAAASRAVHLWRASRSSSRSEPASAARSTSRSCRASASCRAA